MPGRTLKDGLAGSKPNIFFFVLTLGCLGLAMFIKLKNFFFVFFAIAKGGYFFF